ncbi:MAG TPA: GtrA family protein [Bryobacteraceae bacterium]|nr:GtrA family protein [Bryobacteraceae bacterium]
MPQHRPPVPIVIPAYKPGATLVALVDALVARGADLITVVDDGSGPAFAEWFEDIAQRGPVHVLRHAVNLGKGAALKTGLNFVLAEVPGILGVVTADADGQHDADDILRVASRLGKQQESLILGVRQWEKRVPWKSRLGNLVTRVLLHLMVGQKLSDTQTGLRGIPAALIPHLLKITSQGYEFELDMLIACKHRAHPILEEPIRTIYTQGNQSSHFRPVLDSMRIYFLLFRFGMVSFFTAVLDNLVFVLAFRSDGSIARAQIAARLCAMAFNYLGARRVVFHSQQRHAVVLPKYVFLVLGNGLLSYFLIRGLHGGLGWQVVAAKLVAEGFLFVVNFVLQRDFVFTSHGPTGEATDWSAYYAHVPPTAKLTRRYTTTVLLDAIRTHASTADGDGRLGIVEIGGGNSCFLDAILSGVGCRSYDVIDTNEYGLSLLAGKLANHKVLRLHRQSVLELQMRAEADVVFSVGLIEHFDPEDTRKAVHAHFDVLRPGGLLILSFPTPTLLYRITRRLIESLGMWKFPDERALTPDEVTASVEEHGDVLTTKTLWPLLLTQSLVVVRKHASPRPDGPPHHPEPRDAGPQ